MVRREHRHGLHPHSTRLLAHPTSVVVVTHQFCGVGEFVETLCRRYQTADLGHAPPAASRPVRGSLVPFHTSTIMVASPTNRSGSGSIRA